MNKLIAAGLVFAMLAAGLGGCIGGKDDGKLNTGAVEQEKFVFEGDAIPEKRYNETANLIVIEKIPELAVITAPLTVKRTLTADKNGTVSSAEVTPLIVYSDDAAANCIIQQLQPQKIMTFGSVKISGENIPVTTLSEVSLKVAGMLSNPEKTAFIFSDYAIGMAAVPLASYLNAPLVYAAALGEVKEALANMGISRIVTLGSVTGGDEHLSAITDVQERFINMLAEKGDYCDYIVVANAYDVQIEHTDNKFPQDCMSMAAASLAAFRNAVVVPVEFEPADKWNDTAQAEEVKKAAMDARTLLLTHGMVPKYVCIVGDPKAIPMKYYTGCGTGEWAEEGIPTDNYYADFDGNPLTQEIAIGRIVGRHVGDASALAARSAGYGRMVELEKAKGGIGGTGITAWIKNAYFIEGTLQIELFCTGDVVQVNKMLTEGGFITAFRHSALGALSPAIGELYNNNYLIYYGHGGDDGWYYLGVGGGGADAVRIGPEDLEGKVIPPGNGIAGSCLTSALDDMSEYAKAPIDQRISLAFLHAGAISYVGGTRVTWGEVKVWPAMESSCNGMLCNRYIELLTRFNSTLGDALMITKNEYYKMASNMERTVIYIDNNGVPQTYHGLTPWDKRTMLAYPLYGDPAVNPYEYPASDVIFG